MVTTAVQCSHANPHQLLVHCSCQSTAATGLQFMPVHIKCRSTIMPILSNYWYTGLSRSTTTIRPQLMPIYVKHWSTACANHSNYWSTVNANLQQLLNHSSYQSSATTNPSLCQFSALLVHTHASPQQLPLHTLANSQQLLLHSACQSTTTTGPQLM
jgi:hypothetical protein